MVLASHVIFGAYGFWLPNDPRGSWSDFVGAWELLRFGRSTKTTERSSLAHVEHDRVQRLAAKKALKHSPVTLFEEQIESVAKGFGEYVGDSKLVILACSIMPEHVHLVVERFRVAVEQVVIQLKGRASKRLGDDGVHPFQHLRATDGSRPNCWARGEWKVFLDTPEDIARSIRYVEENPVKEGRPAQTWGFVRRSPV